MRPERRRAGRAIRKSRREIGTVTTHLSVRMPQMADAASAAIATIGQAFATVTLATRALAASLRLEATHAQLSLLALAWAPHPIRFERQDMFTVTISTSSTAPKPLVDHLLAFARDLDSEGITANVELIRTCVACGCTDDEACVLGCSWATFDLDLCTVCDSPENRALAAQNQLDVATLTAGMQLEQNEGARS